MSNGQLIVRRMAMGAVVLGLYGLCAASLRLPRDLPVGTLLAARTWALGLFAGAGIVLLGTVGALASGGARLVPAGRRAGAAASIEVALLAPVFVWALLNEVTYSLTSEVIGYETALMIWANPASVLEAAWDMGMRYLLLVSAAILSGTILGWRMSRRSFRAVWPSEKGVRPRLSAAPCGPFRQTGSDPFFAFLGRRRAAGSMTCGLAVLAVLLVWHVHSRPSEALTAVCRATPTLRALNLNRALRGTGLEAPVELGPGAALISREQYRVFMGAPAAPAPNVVMIVLESVPAKALHCYGHARADVSPNLDRLAAEGTLFEHCEGTASFSSYGLVSIMTSLNMLRAENNDHFADTSFPHFSLPRALKLAGYQLALFSSGNEAFDNINRFTPPEEYEHYFSLDVADVPKPDCMRLDDHYAVERFEEWVAGRKDPRPFYCGFYLQSTHFNYEVPEPWASYYQPVPPLYSNGTGIIHIPPDVLPLLKNQYDNALRFSDYWVGRIRAAMERAGVFDNTIVVVVGDHGEAFMEHGVARHGIHLWEEMVHIPFIVYVGPTVKARLGGALPSRVGESVSGVDVAPTVAGLVGIRPHPSWEGADVLAPGYSSRERPLFSVLQLTKWQEVVLLDGFKYIYDLAEMQAQLFDLRSDPGEKVDLAREHPELAAAMRDILAGWHARQMHYYAGANRPFRQYLGAYDPPAAAMERFKTAATGARAASTQAG